jgi:hypothetical protein
MPGIKKDLVHAIKQNTGINVSQAQPLSLNDEKNIGNKTGHSGFNTNPADDGSPGASGRSGLMEPVGAS